MHDFNCTDAADMNYDLMADKTRYLKENPEGVRYMCKVMEDLRNETEAMTKKSIARSMAEDNLPVETIAKYVKESIDTVKKWLVPSGNLIK